MQSTRLKNAPIKEAVIHFQFSEGSQLSQSVIKKIGENVLNKIFPTQNEMFLITMEHDFNSTIKKVKSSDSQKIIGLRFQDAENNWVFQLRTDSLSLSKLKNYISWEEIKDFALKLLHEIKPQIPASKFSRISARYINQFSLTFKDDIIENNLFLVPLIPNGVPTSIDAFDLRIIISKEEEGLKSIVNEAVSPIIQTKGLYNIVLDIDTIKESEYSLKGIKKIENDLELIRNFKNQIFFNSLTEQTLSLFNK